LKRGHIGGERVEDDHVDRLAAAVALPASSSALEAGANGANFCRTSNKPRQHFELAEAD
jgi:hypothetical protein